MAPKYKTLKERGATKTRVDLDDLVGEIIAIKRISVDHSSTYNASYVELEVDVMEDAEAGTVRDSDLTVVSFGKAIVRVLSQWMDESEEYKGIDPPLVVKVAKDNRTFVLLDLDQALPEPRDDGPVEPF